jgi:hypothetical protein
MAPPFGSSTVPEIVPVIACANPETAKIRSRNKPQSNFVPDNLKVDIENLLSMEIVFVITT